MQSLGKATNTKALLFALSVMLNACSQSDYVANEVTSNESGAIEEAAIDRCSTITGSTGLGRTGFQSWFYGVEDGIESDVAHKITENGGFHIEDTLTLEKRCFATARLQGIYNGASYRKYYRCAIKRIYRDENGDLLISSSDGGTCELISSPKDRVRKNVSNIPTVDVLFNDIATGDVIDALGTAGASHRKEIPPVETPRQEASIASSHHDLTEEDRPFAEEAQVLTDQSAALEPIDSPTSWFDADSYPPAARRNGVGGHAEFALEVNARGRVESCEIISSTGSDDLDKATCRIAKSRARFSPKRLRDGSPAPSRYAGSISWKPPI